MHFRRVVRLADTERKRKTERRAKERGSFDSSSLRLQRRKSETGIPCRVYTPTDLDERDAPETESAKKVGICGQILVAVSKEDRKTKRRDDSLNLRSSLLTVLFCLALEESLVSHKF